MRVLYLRVFHTKFQDAKRRCGSTNVKKMPFGCPSDVPVATVRETARARWKGRGYERCRWIWHATKLEKNRAVCTFIGVVRREGSLRQWGIWCRFVAHAMHLLRRGTFVVFDVRPAKISRGQPGLLLPGESMCFLTVPRDPRNDRRPPGRLAIPPRLLTGLVSREEAKDSAPRWRERHDG